MAKKFAISEFSRRIEYEFLKEDHNNNFHTNKTQYDWFPGKSQNSKKFSAKFKQNPTHLKIIGCFLTFWGVKIPPNGHNKFWGTK